MSLKKHTQQLPGWRQYSDALVGWFRDGVADLKSLGIRLEAGRTRRVSLSKHGGNLNVLPASVAKVWSKGGCSTVASHLLSQPVVQRFLADRVLVFGDVSLRWDGNPIPSIDWNPAEKCVELTWPNSNVRIDAAGVWNPVEPYLRAIRIFPNGKGYFVLSSYLLYSVDLEFLP
jgi:hypothetical protein